MKQYKGFYIDGAVFHNEKEIDKYREKYALNAYRIAVELFVHNRNVTNANYVDEMAENLVNNFGYTWEQIEELELELMKIS